MTDEFTPLGLQPELVQSVSDLGYITPTPIQTEIIPLMLDGQDVVGQAQTGTGKTAAFTLPILQNLEPGRQGVQALVLAPTRELAMQVAQAATDHGKHLKIRVLAVYGGQPYSHQINSLRKGVDIVVGTPGRLLDLINKGELDLGNVSTLVLDEADEMLSMGFIEDIEEIISQTPEGRQTALFSATISPEISRMAKKYMHSPKSVTIKSKQLTVDTIEHRYYLVSQDDKLAVLTRLFEVDNMSRTLIFAKTRVGTSELVTELMGRGFPAEALNGDLSQTTREQVLNRFRRGKTSVLVATDVAARGLDIDDISHVINYDLPLDPEMYVHRVGRTGRAGKTGIAISLITYKEKWRLSRIENYARQKLARMEIPTVEEIEARREKQLLEQIKIWLERGRCQKELQIVQGLVEEGQDPLHIAATALKLARSEEKQRPIARLKETMQGSSAKPRREFYRKIKETGRNGGNGFSGSGRNGGNGSVSMGMVRMTLGAGKTQGVQPADVVGTIAYHANIPGSSLGEIIIHDKHTLVEVPLKYVDKILANAGKYRLKKSVVTLGLA